MSHYDEAKQRMRESFDALMEAKKENDGLDSMVLNSMLLMDIYATLGSIQDLLEDIRDKGI